MKKLSQPKEKKSSFPKPGTPEWFYYTLKNMKWSSVKTKFSLLAGINRPVTPQQVTKIADSSSKITIIRPVVVAVVNFINGKEERYIIDGQHLYMALLRLNLDIPYVEINVSNKQELVETIALLNSSSKAWNMQDYVTAWSNLSPDYVKLNHYYQQYDFELNILASVLSHSDPTYKVTTTIKNGTFKIKNENQAKEILDYLTDLFKVLNRGSRYEIKYLCSEYVKFYRSSKNYNHTKFINNIKKNKAKLDLANLEAGKLVKVFQTFC